MVPARGRLEARLVGPGPRGAELRQPLGRRHLTAPACVNRATRKSHTKDHIMREATSPALKVALAFHEAWASKDLDRALSYLAEDIVCDAPAGRMEGIAAYR